jgi:hypothetical protein
MINTPLQRKLLNTVVLLFLSKKKEMKEKNSPNIELYLTVE